jgi:hypothetical protein
VRPTRDACLSSLAWNDGFPARRRPFETVFRFARENRGTSGEREESQGERRGVERRWVVELPNAHHLLAHMAL